MARRGVLSGLRRIFMPRRRAGSAVPAEPLPGQHGASQTREAVPPAALRINYAPQRDGEPDAGEIIWTWVPYQEHDGRGKDRPVLVIGRESADRVYALRLTSKPHHGEREYLPIGTGDWDGRGRMSWLDLDQLYSVHRDGMRREAASLDMDQFAQVAEVLGKRFGWDIG